MGVCLVQLGVKDMFEQGTEQIQLGHRQVLVKAFSTSWTIEYTLFQVSEHLPRLFQCPNALPSLVDQDFPGERLLGRVQWAVVRVVDFML